MKNELRLIDANDLQQRLAEARAEPDYQHPGEDWRIEVYMADTIVEQMSTVDVVAVVRCRDCKHWSENEYVPEYGSCQHGHWEIPDACLPSMHANDFCSYGERIPGGDDL